MNVSGLWCCAGLICVPDSYKGVAKCKRDRPKHGGPFYYPDDEESSKLPPFVFALLVGLTVFAAWKYRRATTVGGEPGYSRVAVDTNDGPVIDMSTVDTDSYQSVA